MKRDRSRSGDRGRRSRSRSRSRRRKDRSPRRGDPPRPAAPAAPALQQLPGESDETFKKRERRAKFLLAQGVATEQVVAQVEKQIVYDEAEAGIEYEDINASGGMQLPNKKMVESYFKLRSMHAAPALDTLDQEPYDQDDSLDAYLHNMAKDAKAKTQEEAKKIEQETTIDFDRLMALSRPQAAPAVVTPIVKPIKREATDAASAFPDQKPLKAPKKEAKGDEAEEKAVKTEVKQEPKEPPEPAAPAEDELPFELQDKVEADTEDADAAFHRAFMNKMKKQDKRKRDALKKAAQKQEEADKLAQQAVAAADVNLSKAQAATERAAKAQAEARKAKAEGEADDADLDESERLFDNPDEAVEEDFVDKNSTANLSYHELAQKFVGKKELPPTDHAKIKYMEFKKNFYIECRDLTNMKAHEVDSFRKASGDIRVRGKYCPKPIKNFNQSGLNDNILRQLARRGYEHPFPIQMQAIPALMCGRDVIGIAETGSGKTLAFLLPMFRHVMDQPILKDGDGFIGLIMGPTRELCTQISKEAGKFTDIVGLKTVACYGGTALGEQLGQLKRGCEIVVATPGRLIDVLTISNGKVTNLRRVTFLVLDEADRMFDMGFEKQISQVIRNLRPDRQVAMFSATFPPHIEGLAKKLLHKPLEIVIGQRGGTASRIVQKVEVMSQERKFYRLLQLLGEWSDHGQIIIFVSKQNDVDNLFDQLFKHGYSALTLHGGQDQTDREFSISDFKEGVRTILIATSIASRGLDCKAVVLVINYAAPDHLEDYVHRIGRTGRAGQAGFAYTFITDEESDKAQELIDAVRQAGQEVPSELVVLAEKHAVQVSMGTAKKRKKWGGFGGRSFTFDNTEKSRQQKEKETAKADLKLVDTKEEEKKKEQLEDAFAEAKAAQDAKTGGGDAKKKGGATLMQISQELNQANAKAGRDLDKEAVAPAAAPKFEAASEWAGPKKGFVFKLGPSGLGYYGDVKQGAPARKKKNRWATPVDAVAAAPAAPAEPAAPVEPKVVEGKEGQISSSAAALPGLVLVPDKAEAKQKQDEGKALSFRERLALDAAKVMEKVEQTAAPTISREQKIAQAKQAQEKVTGKKGAPPPPKGPPPKPAVKVTAKPGAPPPPRGPPPPKAKAATPSASAQPLLHKPTVFVPTNLPPGARAPGMNMPGQMHLVNQAPLEPAPALLKAPVTRDDGVVQDELEINSYPEWARRQMIYGRNLSGVEDRTGARCQLKGQYFPAGADVPITERKLYIEVTGPTLSVVQRAKSAVYQMIEGFAIKTLQIPSGGRRQ